MNRIILKTSIVFLLLFVTQAGCEKKAELPLYHAKGSIIAVTSQFYSDMVIIEVENPKGIGKKGTFNTIGKDIDISYENAIGVPYFSQIGLPDSVPQIVGTWLYFEYREFTNEEKEQDLYWLNPTLICQAIYGSPSVAPFIITKIFNYK